MGMKSKCLFTFAYKSLTDLLLPVPVQFGDAEACREFTTIPIVQRNTKAPYLFNLISLFLKIIEKKNKLTETSGHILVHILALPPWPILKLDPTSKFIHFFFFRIFQTILHG